MGVAQEKNSRKHSNRKTGDGIGWGDKSNHGSANILG